MFRGGAICLSFVSVALAYRVLGAEDYGIWAVLLSLSTWAFFLDFGVVNGARNELSKSF